MALLLASERPTVAHAFQPIRRIGRWLAKARADRAQRLALADLLEFDAALLADLGIERQDVVEAMRSPTPKAAAALASRRAENARNWYNP